MRLKVKYLCHDCHQVNKQELGMPGFELIDCEWETISAAVNHVIQHPDHWVDTQVIDESEE